MGQARFPVDRAAVVWRGWGAAEEGDFEFRLAVGEGRDPHPCEVETRVEVGLQFAELQTSGPVDRRGRARACSPIRPSTRRRAPATPDDVAQWMLVRSLRHSSLL
jgi:hypothetical protein